MAAHHLELLPLLLKPRGDERPWTVHSMKQLLHLRGRGEIMGSIILRTDRDFPTTPHVCDPMISTRTHTMHTTPRISRISQLRLRVPLTSALPPFTAWCQTVYPSTGDTYCRSVPAPSSSSITATCPPCAASISGAHPPVHSGCLLRRGGGQTRWHSLVDCNHGDSSSSRLRLTRRKAALRRRLLEVGAGPDERPCRRQVAACPGSVSILNFVRRTAVT
jgi:hypothetical protein